jgi:hypothetical protein
MLLTWKLWRALRNPPSIDHAVYRRVAAEAPLELKLSMRLDPRWGRLLIILIAIYVVVRFGIIGLLALFFVVPALIVLLFMLVPLALPLIGALLGAFWAANIARTIVKERDAHTYDLLCISPDGSLGANWALASGCLHQGGLFMALRLAVTAMLVIGAIFIGLLLLMCAFLVVQGVPGETLTVALRTTGDFAAIVAIFAVHHVQTMVLSALVGVYVPTRISGYIDAPWLAGLMNVALQVGSYLVYYFLLTGLSALAATIPPSAPLPYLAVPVIYVLSFGLLRELLIVWLWETVATRLNANRPERDILMRQFS